MDWFLKEISAARRICVRLCNEVLTLSNSLDSHIQAVSTLRNGLDFQEEAVSLQPQVTLLFSNMDDVFDPMNSYLSKNGTALLKPLFHLTLNLSIPLLKLNGRNTHRQTLRQVDFINELVCQGANDCPQTYDRNFLAMMKTQNRRVLVSTEDEYHDAAIISMYLDTEHDIRYPEIEQNRSTNKHSAIDKDLLKFAESLVYDAAQHHS